MRSRLRIGTRGSKLALVQTNEVIEAFKRVRNGGQYDVVPIHTKGDRRQELAESISDGKSAFTAEIEQALTKGDVDVAVHSMKDLPTDMAHGVLIGAIPKRASARDVLISRSKTKFQQLQGGARIGTSSARRKAQLLAARGDLQVIEMHGNVDTRLRKLEKGECEAIVLAAAGLERLGLGKQVTELLPTEIMLPAVGQGALAIQCREDDNEVLEALAKIDHKPTRRAVVAERAFARKLGADCRTPVAAYARVESGSLVIDGMVAAPSGRLLVRSRIISDNPNAESVGEELGDLLLMKGAAGILEVA
jgi:hydroxymethylbilane synthase